MQKRLLLIVSVISLLFILATTSYAINISAKGAVLIEASHGEVTFGKNENMKLPMASTTKIMTALVVLENAELDKLITIEPCMTGIEGSSIYLQVGEQLTVEELLYALLLESANDASVALAISVAGSVEEFANLMNKKAEELKLEQTHFTNPHGLDDACHYTTPYELAIISAEAIKNEKFAEIVSTYKKEIPSSIENKSRLLVNHNRLLRSYDGAIGIKTGFTKKCGRCLVSCATKDGVTLVCVTLNAPNDWQDHKMLLDYGFSQYEEVTLAAPDSYLVELNCIGGDKSSFLAGNNEALSVVLRRGDHNIHAVVEANRLISPSIAKNDCVGRIVFYNNDEVIGNLPLYAKESVNRISYKKSLFERIFNYGKN